MSKQIKMTSKDGITLYTGNKFVPEDIHIIPGDNLLGATIKTKGGWQGTQVPNNSYVENLYFNINLSVEEVVSIIENASLNYLYQNIGYVCLTFDDQDDVANACVIVHHDDIYYILYLYGDAGTYLFSSGIMEEYGIEFVGWNPELEFSEGILPCNNTLISSYFRNGVSIPVGTHNGYLSSLISTTPFTRSEGEEVKLSGEYDGSSVEVTENGNVDIKALIDEKKIPLNIKVNVSTGSSIEGVTEDNTQITITTDKQLRVNSNSNIGLTKTNEVTLLPSARTTLKIPYAGAVVNATNLEPQNIKKDVNILGVVGTCEGGSGVIEVSEFPTENIKEDTIYQVNEVSDLNVFIKTDGNTPSTLEEAIAYLGATPNITFYLVNELPTNPQVSNLQTFNPAYVYIYNDTAYTYGNAGYGNMWLGVKDLVSSVMEIPYEDKGYVESDFDIVEQGIYVTYKLGKQGILNKEKYSMYYNDNNSWNDTKSVDLLGVFLREKRIDLYKTSYISLKERRFYEANIDKIVITNITTKVGSIEFHPLGVECFTNCKASVIILQGKAELLYSYGSHFGYVRDSNGTGEKYSIITGNQSFYNCSNLTTLVLDFSKFDTLTHSDVPNFAEDMFYNTPIANGTGYIYVPDTLVDTVKALDGWSMYATQIKPISELPQEYKDLYEI